MGDFANYAESAFLQELFNTTQAGITAVTSTKVKLHTGDPGEAGTLLEVLTANWSNYAPLVVYNDNVTNPNWGLESGGQVSNDDEVDFGTATIPGADVEVKAISVTDQADNVIYKGPLSTGRVHCVGLNTGDIIHSDAHGFSNDQKVVFEDFGGQYTLPAGLSAYTEYYVISSATDNFQVSTSQGGAAVAITADGQAIVGLSKFKIVQDQDQVKFPVGDIDLALF